MDDPVSIPRRALEELLKASGSSLTPEAYLASLSEASAYPKYRSRTKTALWSRNTLVLVLVIAVISLLSGFDVEGVLILVALAVITKLEFKVHRYFRDRDPRAPLLGFYNQLGFAAFILCYGLYHAAFPHAVPPELRDMIDPAMAASIQSMVRVFYLLIGFVGAVSQVWLAWYYKSADVKT